MKKLFINEDGTIKLKIVLYAILLFLFLIILIMYACSSLSSKITDDEETIATTTKTTTTMNLCKDCKLNFSSSSYNMKINETLDIKSILEIKSINIKNIKLSDYDESLIELKSDKNSILIKSLNKLGSTKLKASYQNKETVITINVFSDYITSATVYPDNYYIYVGTSEKIVLNTNPDNVDANFFDVKVSDEEIATIKDGVIFGNKIGSTTISLDYNGINSNSKLYVIKNRIAIYIMDNNKMKEFSKYNTKDKNIKILVKSLDKNINSDELIYSINNDGKITYIEPDLEEENTFKYEILLGEHKEYELTFSLSDGSKTGMIIELNE